MIVTDHSRERAIVGGAFLAIMLAAWPTLISLPLTWATSGHGYFVAALTAWLIWRDRNVLFASPGPGVGDLVPVLAVLSIGWLFAVVMNVTSVHEGLLTVMLVVWAFATFGWQARRTILSIGLTFWLAVPLWGATQPVLQRATVIMSGGATRLAGISAEIGYDYVSLTSGTFLVEAGCSGINYLMGALVLGAFYVHFFVRRWQTQLKIIALVGAVSIVGNWIRVSVLIFIGEATAMQSSLLGDHLWQGWLIFTLLMIPTYFVARRIEIRDAGKVDSTPRSSEASYTVSPLRARRAVVAAVATMVGPLLFVGVGIIPRGAEVDRDIADVQLADSWGEIGAVGMDPSGWTPAFRGIDETLTWALEVDDATTVYATRHYFVDQRQGEELVQWGNQVAPGSELVTERFVGPVGPLRRFVREAIILTDAGPRVVWYWYRVARFDTPFPSKAKLLEIVAFFRRTPASELITVSAACAAEDCTAAANTLRSIASEGEPPPGSPGSTRALVDLPAGAEAISFLGDTLVAPEQPAAVREVYLARYAEAQDALVEAPEDADALVWMGRRTAYLGQYRAAIDIYGHAMDLHPDDARLYRHRGHRYLTVREPDHAITDFERAAVLTAGRPDEVEPDGLPNAMNIPTGTLQFNIWYHLALAHYVKGEFEAALEAQRSCLAVSVHPDSVVATSYWLYMTLRRLGMDAEAEDLLNGISSDMAIIESTAYLDLLLLFKGQRTLEDLVGPSGGDATLQSTTTAYGAGVWHLLNGRTDDALAIWERILTGRSQWSAFGYIAAEAEVARIRADR